MKLHAFDIIIKGKRFRCLVRDRSIIQRKNVELESGVVVGARDWKYHGPIDVTARQSPLVAQIIERVKAVGLVVTSMPDIPTVFYVFDVEFNLGDARVYSNDPELVEYQKAIKQMQLGVDGEKWGGEEPVLKGQVEIDSKVAAMRMGVDYDRLLARGFWVAVLREITVKQQMERSILHKVREKVRPWGVLVTDLQIKDSRVYAPTAPSIGGKENQPSRGKNTAKAPAREIAPTPFQHNATTQRAREQLCTQLNELRKLSNPQQRGYELEAFLNELFAIEGLRPRGPFRIEGEQIDGSFVWRNHTHLVEAKWTKLQAAGAELGAFGFKLDGKTADTRGLFVSVDGYSSDGLAALRTKGSLKFVCLDGEHLAAAVKPSGCLMSILDQVWRHADETGEPYISSSKL